MNKLSSILDFPLIQQEFKQAWIDSEPSLIGRHEEGGFILKDSSGQLSIERWSKGRQNEIIVPSHPKGKYQDKEIIATFHTHPNTGTDFQQEPSDTDIRAVKNDPNLKTEVYEGEYVITKDFVYRIDNFGNVTKAGKTQEILKGSEL